MAKIPLEILIPLIPCSLVVLAAGAGQAETGFLKRTVTTAHGEYVYQVYVPQEWSPDREWPVILFLHGAGERGDDEVAQTTVGLGPAILRGAERFPAVAVMPQCRRDTVWSDPEMEAQALAALEAAVAEFNGDEDRIYLTGLSMGGYGTFYFAAKYPGRFAALVPVCGGVVHSRLPTGGLFAGAADPYRDAAQRIGAVPTWLFHGAEDRAVPVTESRRMAQALGELDGEVRYTEYEGVGHNSWDPAYAEPELMTWLLSQSRPRPK